MRRQRAALERRFLAGESVETLVLEQTRQTDRLLRRAWRRHPALAGGDLALVAVGGYGRGELHPHSDIDLLILCRGRMGAAAAGAVEGFLVSLWDAGLQIGHSVRTASQCMYAARADLSVLTAMMEARLLLGRADLAEAMRDAVAPGRICPAPRFLRHKLREQEERHNRIGRHNLEPNLKDGPGGLRDIHTVAWVAIRHFGGDPWRRLRRQGLLLPEESRALEEGRVFLWRIRYALHMLAGRREERLLFDYQRRIAELLGHTAPGNAGVERFMREYYRATRRIGLLNEILLRQLGERIAPRASRGAILLNRRFGERDGQLEVRDSGVFRRYPHALLEPFLLLMQTERLDGLATATMRLIRDSARCADDNFRGDLRTRSLFLEIIGQPRGVGRALRRMHRYGVLAAVLPAFGAIEGRMQFDLFHIHTVDAHILAVLERLDGFAAGSSPEFPMCYELMRQIPKRQLLYLAALMHDIGKGRQGDHSLLGAQEALDFCHYLGLGEYDSQLVAWLTEYHLILSHAAQHEDLDDPAVIERFIEKVGDPDHLNYLYLLTVADISGTHPKLWNSWKNHLLGTLYDRVLQALRRGRGRPIAKDERIRETREQALSLLGASRRPPAKRLWQRLGEEYFLRYRADEIAWHALGIVGRRQPGQPLVLVKRRTSRDCTEVFLHLPERGRSFTAATWTLDQLGLSIVDARIVTAPGGSALDSYSVLERNGECVRGRQREREIAQRLRQVLARPDIPLQVNRLASRQVRSFQIETRVVFLEDPDNDRIIMEVATMDRPGLLFRIGTALRRSGLQLQGAKIATYGERVRDFFFLVGEDGDRQRDAARRQRLRGAILEMLGEH